MGVMRSLVMSIEIAAWLLAGEAMGSHNWLACAFAIVGGLASRLLWEVTA